MADGTDNLIPRVSIGMPVYNGQTYLAEAIDSILGQTFTDFELVISDNGSTDQTPAILREYEARDSRVRVLYNDENRGAAWNYNKTFEMARGAYFKWSACDDLWGATFLEQAVALLDGNPEVVWVHSRSRHIDPDGKPLINAHFPDVSYVACDEGPTPTFFRPVAGAPQRGDAKPSRRFTSLILNVHSNMDVFGLIRREVVAETMMHLPFYGSDRVFMTELALRGRYLEIPAFLFLNRVHPEASGAMAKAEDQQAFMDPSRVGKLRAVRFRILKAYARAVMRSPISPLEKLRCMITLARYLLQVKRWGRVIGRTLTGKGTGGGYLAAGEAAATSQDDSPERETTAVRDSKAAANHPG